MTTEVLHHGDDIVTVKDEVFSQVPFISFQIFLLASNPGKLSFSVLR